MYPRSQSHHTAELRWYPPVPGSDDASGCSHHVTLGGQGRRHTDDQ
jgi:hypothetical protein